MGAGGGGSGGEARATWGGKVIMPPRGSIGSADPWANVSGDGGAEIQPVEELGPLENIDFLT